MKLAWSKYPAVTAKSAQSIGRPERINPTPRDAGRYQRFGKIVKKPAVTACSRMSSLRVGVSAASSRSRGSAAPIPPQGVERYDLVRELPRGHSKKRECAARVEVHACD